MRKSQGVYLVCLASAIGLAVMRPGFISTLVLYMTLLLPLAEITLLLFSMVAFHLSHQINKMKVNKDEAIQYDIQLTNQSFILLNPITIKYIGSDLLFKDNALDVAPRTLYPFQKEGIKQILTCRYRGIYHVGIQHVTFHGFFNLLDLTLRRSKTHELMVYPKIYPFRRTSLNQQVTESSESLLSFDKRDKSNFSEVRPYEVGDSLKRIHWKLSAKNDKWMTKSYEGNVNHHAMLLIDNRTLPYELEENIVIEDQLIEATVSITQHMLENNAAAELIWQGQDHRSIKGDSPADFGRFYEALATLTFDADKNQLLQTLLNKTDVKEGRALIMLFTISLDAELGDLLKRLKQSGYDIQIIAVDPQTLGIHSNVHLFDMRVAYELIDEGIMVLKPIFEDSVCRMEVM